MFGTIQDITHRKQADKELRLAASVFSHAREGIIIADADGIIIDVNKALSETTGYSHDEAVGKHLETIQSYRQEDRGGDRGWWCDVSTCGCWTGEIWNRRKNGQRYPGMLTVSAVCDSAGQPQHYIALLTDIAGLKRQELNREHRAYHDPLTDLPNRTLLADRLRHSMAQADRNRGLVAIVYLDLDGFKAVNDSYGHDVGDKVLTVLAIRFRGAVREADTLSRIGGDEFVAVLSDLAHASDSEPIVSRLLVAAASPIHVGKLEVAVSVSAGVTFYPQEKNVNAEELIRQADIALYQAKIAGKNCGRPFDGQQLHPGRGREGSPVWVRLALQQGAFLLHYQPQVNMRTGAVLGFEALLRWRRADGGIVPLGAFLPRIEDDGAAIELDRWVLSAAAAQLNAWHAQGTEMPLNVNIGAKMLQDVDFSSYLRGLIAEYPLLRAGFLRLEVVETSALADVALAAQTMERCRDLGVGFLLDDFGTGYSSLAYLKSLPIKEIKIDRSFVRDIPCDPDSFAILEGILALGQKFALSVLAEGVETEQHGRILIQLGCELGQGFAIAVPMPAEAVSGWLQSWTPPRVWSSQGKVADEVLPLLHAKAEVRALSRMVEGLAINCPLPLPRLDQYELEFGKWLKEHAEDTGGASDTLKVAKHLHRDLHDLAAELDSLRRAGQGPEFLTRARDFNATRDRLLSAVDALAEEFGGASPTRGGRKTP
jgi:diguanylate cyclase (GGDEF)-like protein/PAS domain S-box-containing protein